MSRVGSTVRPALYVGGREVTWQSGRDCGLVPFGKRGCQHCGGAAWAPAIKVGQGWMAAHVCVWQQYQAGTMWVPGCQSVAGKAEVAVQVLGLDLEVVRVPIVNEKISFRCTLCGDRSW